MKCHFGKQQKTITHTEIWTMSQTIQLDVFLQGFCKKYRDKELCEASFVWDREAAKHNRGTERKLL